MGIFGMEMDKVSGAGKFGGHSRASAGSDPKERATGTQRLQTWTGNHHIQICKEIAIFHCLHIATKSFHFKYFFVKET
jgi:phage protein D